MKWTTERPTTSGFYWVYEPRLKRPPTLCEVTAEGGDDPHWYAVVIGCDQLSMADEFDPASLWCGPINPPEVPI